MLTSCCFFKQGVLFPFLFLINSLLFVSFSSLNASQQGFENTPLPYKPPKEESWICETACADVCVKRKQHPPPCTGGEMPSKHNCYGSPRCINSVITVCLIVKAVISIKEGWAYVCVCVYRSGKSCSPFSSLRLSLFIIIRVISIKVEFV